MKKVKKSTLVIIAQIISMVMMIIHAFDAFDGHINKMYIHGPYGNESEVIAIWGTRVAVDAFIPLLIYLIASLPIILFFLKTKTELPRVAIIILILDLLCFLGWWSVIHYFALNSGCFGYPGPFFFGVAYTIFLICFVQINKKKLTKSYIQDTNND